MLFKTIIKTFLGNLVLLYIKFSIQLIVNATGASVEILSPFRHEILGLAESNTDGNKGISMNVVYKIHNFTIPSDGVMRVSSNSLSQPGLLLTKYTEVQNGILTLHNVQAGTHVINFQLMKYGNNNKSYGIEVCHANAFFEVVPSKINLISPLSPASSSVVVEKLELLSTLSSQTIRQSNGLGIDFPTEENLQNLIKLYKQKYGNNCKIKIAVVGTLLLDGQRTIWIEQWKQMSSAHQDIFEVYYFCFACDEHQSGPLLPYLSSLNISYIRTETFKIPPGLYYTENFPDNLYGLLRKEYQIALDKYHDVNGMSRSTDETVRLFYKIFIQSLIAFVVEE